MTDQEYLNFIENLKSKSRENWIPIVRDNTLDLILMIMNISNAKNILEIGTAVGYSAIQFAKHIKDAKITTIEINEETANMAISNIKQVGLQDRITVINDDAKNYMNFLIQNNKKFDLIFIDAAKSQYQIYLDLAKSLSFNGSLILLDNVLLSGMVKSDYNEHKHRTQVNKLRKFLEDLKNDKNLLSTIIEIEDGLAIAKYIAN